MIYLDNAATSYPKPEIVYTALGRFLREVGGNPGRGSYRVAVEAERVLIDVRGKLARLIKAATPDRVIFTCNTTDALNMAIKGALREGDHVITSELEHNSVLRPLARLKQTRQIQVTTLPFDVRGQVDPDAFRRAITPRTRMLILTHASNVIGTIQPIEEVGKIARDHNLLFLVDAAQTLGKVDINVQTANIDLLAGPGHKGLMGPPGTGFLYVGERAVLEPWREGGTGGNSLLELQPPEYPFFLEAGTPNTVGLAALGVALEYLAERGIDRIREHELQLLELLADELCQLPDVSIFGPPDLDHAVGVISFTMEVFEPQEVGIVLDESFDIAVRSGLHCAPLTHKRLGTSPTGTIRVSPGAFTTVADIEQFISALKTLALS
ncbi:MAG TPA: aminotransferase class V-fold PLP-dependent enzyme [Acidobacteriota bacterium]|nr:aminotransferase class V-fold PLP-dependent enzyme [Acidobacteriota bacterium]HND21392.1 aminotransferase class V-fold PLP-dependent enzyme [Acidobacteriota bacterium]